MAVPKRIIRLMYTVYKMKNEQNIHGKTYTEKSKSKGSGFAISNGIHLYKLVRSKSNLHK